MPASIEEPYVNQLRTTRIYWKGCGGEGEALFNSGVVSRGTGLPVKTPNGCSLTSEVLFPPGASKRHWDGDWVAICEGGAAKLSMPEVPKELQVFTAPGRLTFTHNERMVDHSPLMISQITKPCEKLALVRAENEAAWRAGTIYNPAFTKAMDGYDIVRSMDLQSANGAVIRSIDDLATMAALQWGASDWNAATSEEHFRYAQPFQGTPLAAVFALPMEADAELWFQAPMTLGAPRPFFDFQPADNRQDKWAAAFADSIVPVAPQVLESEEWDRYADAFVEALIASGYPADRPLYVSIANEVWNWSNHYFLTTTYAQRMGRGLEGYLPISEIGFREAYGAMVARLKLATDEALEEAGRDQKIIYVIEGQAAWVDLTGAALRGAKAYMDKHGEVWASHAPDFGVSVASYWGYNEGVTESGIDPSNHAALEDHFLNGSERLLGTKANVIELFRGAQAQGAKYGVKLIGAYEGGPHFTRPWNQGADGRRDYLMTEDEYREFIWGERGGRVNYEINKALAEEFPGIILSNYALAGTPGGQPWFEGPLGAQNPYAKSWEALMALEAEDLDQ
jgi:hypothetical protein